MWKLEIPFLELMARAVIVYIFLLIILRITGKRQVGQLAPFDLILLLVLSNAVQNAMNGGDNSVTAGIIIATTLIFFNYIVGLLTYRSKWLEGVIEGRPEIVIHNGKLYEKALKNQRLTHHELNAALREAGCINYDDVHLAVIENNGHINVIAKKEDEQIKEKLWQKQP